MVGNLARVLVVLACLPLGGCFSVVTHGIGAVERGLSTGKSFAAWRTAMPPIPPGDGRLVVYPGGGRSLVYETTGIGKGGEQLFVIDRDVCEVLGRSFVFLDVAAGRHVLSADGVSKLFGYQVGRNRLPLNVAAGSLSYIRIEKHGAGPLSHRYVPAAVTAATAEADIRDWPLYEDGLGCRRNRAEDREP